MDVISTFAEWAWARHHNPLSWYIRPLFLLPYCYFAWRRSLAGMVASIFALATSMFWFPAPATPDPAAIAFLEAERQYLRGPWTAAKVMFAAMVPLFFAVVGLAFWRRSVGWGIAAINAGSLIKIGWSFHYGGASGWTVVVPALVGLAVINGMVYLALNRWRRVPKLRR
jgi:hypothetical protein